MGILDQARRNAETGMRSLLETFGVKSMILANPVGNTLSHSYHYWSAWTLTMPKADFLLSWSILNSIQ
jgi:hypothetical protein